MQIAAHLDEPAEGGRMRLSMKLQLSKRLGSAKLRPSESEGKLPSSRESRKFERSVRFGQVGTRRHHAGMHRQPWAVFFSSSEGTLVVVSLVGAAER